MVIFHSFLYVYQRVNGMKWGIFQLATFDYHRVYLVLHPTDHHPTKQ